MLKHLILVSDLQSEIQEVYWVVKTGCKQDSLVFIVTSFLISFWFK